MRAVITGLIFICNAIFTAAMPLSTFPFMIEQPSCDCQCGCCHIPGSTSTQCCGTDKCDQPYCCGTEDLQGVLTSGSTSTCLNEGHTCYIDGPASCCDGMICDGLYPGRPGRCATDFPEASAVTQGKDGGLYGDGRDLSASLDVTPLTRFCTTMVDTIFVGNDTSHPSIQTNYTLW